MTDTVKHYAGKDMPPNNRFCGVCGCCVGPIISDMPEDEFCGCPYDCDNPVDCPQMAGRWCKSVTIAEAMQRAQHPETLALFDRLGIPQSVRDGWRQAWQASLRADEELRRLSYSSLDGPDTWLDQLEAWIGDDEHAIERFLALLKHLSPQPPLPMSMAEIGNWHHRLGVRAADILSQIADYEMDATDG